MRILVAPNSFKECASSIKITDVMIEALRKNGFKDLVRFPISDGGDGFLDVCKENYGLNISTAKIRNCFNGEHATVRIGKTNSRDITYLEAAEFIGLRTIPKDYRNPLKLSSYNLGVYLRKQFKKNGSTFSKITIGIGGTGTNDFGLGLCVPFGLKLFDRKENELEVKPENYSLVKRIILPDKAKLEIEVVLDVKIPLYGKGGTSKVFAEQKGASKEDIERLEKGAKNILAVLNKEHKINFTNVMIGAGGGLTLGLMLIAKPKVTTSQQFLVKNLGLKNTVRNADIIISGEGKIDSQSYMEKATGILINESLKQKKKVFLIVGINALPKNVLVNNLKIVSLVDQYKNPATAIKYYKKGIIEAVSILKKSFGC